MSIEEFNNSRIESCQHDIDYFGRQLVDLNEDKSKTEEEIERLKNHLSGVKSDIREKEKQIEKSTEKLNELKN